jgi:hypothetical protein
MSDLVELARRYVATSEELERLRDQIKLAVLNGSTPEPEAKANFTKPAVRRAAGNHPNAIKAAKMDSQIADLLRATPGLMTAEIAKATGSRTSTTVERLKRMVTRGLAQRDESGGYSAPPPA